MSLLHTWFKGCQGYLYCEDGSFNDVADPLNTIYLYPRIRKRAGLSDIVQIPGLVSKNPNYIKFPHTHKINNNIYVWKFKSPIYMPNKRVKEYYYKLFGIEGLEDICVDFNLCRIETNTSIEYSINDFLNKIDIDQNNSPIFNDGVGKSKIEALNLDQSLKEMINTGETDALWGKDLSPIIALIHRLTIANIEYETIVDIFLDNSLGISKYFRINGSEELYKILSLFSNVKNQDVIPSNQNNYSEYVVDRRDGYYLAKHTSEGIRINRLSNFLIHPHYTVQVDDDEILYCSMVIEGDNYPIDCQLRKNDLMGWKEFIRAIPSNRVIWLGKDKEVQLLRAWINSLDIPRKKGIKQIGYFEGRYVLPSCSVKDGEYIEDDSVVYIDNHSIALSNKVTNHWQNLSKEILSNIININKKEESTIALAWLLCSPLAQAFRKINGNFPILKVWGTQGSGKTTFVSMLWKILGFNSEPKSCNRTAFSLIRDLSASNCFPVVLDEYKPAEIAINKLDHLHYLLRLAYNGSIESRGQANLTVREFPLTTPVIISGEMPFIDPSLVERSIIINLKPSYVKLNNHCVEAYNSLLSIKIDEFLIGYLQWITKNLDVENLIHKNINFVKDILKDKKPALRIMQNIATIATGIDIINELCPELEISKFEIVNFCYTGITSGNTTNYIDRFMSYLNDMAVSNFIKEGTDYNVVNNSLYFATDVCIAAFAKYCQIHGLKSEFMGKEAIRQQLSEMKDVQSYVNIPYGKVYKMPVSRRSVRCTEIDLTKLENIVGINKQSWYIDDDPLTEV